MGMEIEFLNHGGKELTGRFMYHYAQNFPQDLGGFSSLPFPAWYDRVKSIRYKSDDELFPEDPGRVVEVVGRPAILLNRRIFPFLDCKKKSILCGAWAASNNRPFCFLAVSEKPNGEVHHVVPVIDFDGRGMQLVDPTLPEYRIGQIFPITYAEELQR